jgi:hypothetical protein
MVMTCKGARIKYADIKFQIFILYKVFILSDNYQLPLPVGSIIVWAQSAEPTVHTCDGIVAGSDKRWLSDRTKTLN